MGTEQEHRDPPAPDLSVVIPTFDAAEALPATLRTVGAGAGPLCPEIVIADGGSRDATAVVAQAAGARVVRAPRGRGSQLAAGAAAAGGRWLLFLHADTRLAPGWGRAVAAFMAAPVHHECAAYFAFALDDDAAAARRLERIVAWRSRRLGLPYGDQGLLVGRALYDRVGGYRPLPLMEDVDLVRRIGRARLVGLDLPATTSAVRYRRSGYLRRSARNLACLALYRAGLPPRLIARLYG